MYYTALIAYAILHHRMFDIHVMVRLGLRYAAARGLLLSIMPATALVLAVDLMTHGNQPLIEIARGRGLLYAAVASGAFLLHVRQKSLAERARSALFPRAL